jgi:hypothetical protein
MQIPKINPRLSAATPVAGSERETELDYTVIPPN